MVAPNATMHKQFQATIVGAAEMFGYVTMGVFPLRDSHGIPRTPTTLKGWPDLTLFRPPRFLAAEVKTGKSRLRNDQRAVLSLLAQIPCARTAVIHPDDDWKEVVRWLRRPAEAPAVLGYVPMEGDLRAYLKAATKSELDRTTSRVPWPKW